MKISVGGGGGILLGISNEGFPNPILVCQGDDNVELLVVQIEIGPIPVRLFCAYGPQEGSKDCLAFYQRLEEEVENAIDADCGIIMELDANAKLIIFQEQCRGMLRFFSIYLMVKNPIFLCKKCFRQQFFQNF